MLRTLLSSRFLVSQLTKREIESQFRGTVLGWLWLFARPLLMLSVYTFVFGVIWRKNSIGEPLAAFSLQLFCGLCIYNFFSQAVSKSVNCIVGKPSFVKQLVFPLEILPWVQTLASFILCLPWFVLLFAGLLLSYGRIPFTALLFPFWLLPLFLFTAGCVWFFSALGVYMRDLKQLMPVLLQILFFLSPVFWNFGLLTGRKAALIPYLRLNPIADIIEESRKLLIYGGMTDWQLWALVTAASVVIFCLGYAWFQKVRKGFADVI